LNKILPGSLDGLVPAASHSAAQTLLETAATATNYFTVSNPQYDSLVAQLTAQTQQSFDVFVSVRRQLTVPFREKIKDLRTLAIANPQIETLKESKIIMSRLLQRMDALAFKYRFNILALRNEAAAYDFWRFLPQSVPTKFQIAPHASVLSVPSLLVPFTSTIDYADFNAYGVPRSLPSSIPGTVRAECPRCLPSSAAQPYFPDLSPTVVAELFTMRFPEFGPPKRLIEVHVQFGPSVIRCLLVIGEGGQFLVTDAVLEHGVLAIEAVSDSTVVNVFLDACASRLYGDSALFFGHVVLRIPDSHIISVLEKQFHMFQTAVEIWLARGTSLFLIFLDGDAAHEIALHWRSCVKWFSGNRCASPIYSLRMASPDELRKQWLESRLPSLYYLLALNQLSGRTFAAPSQYPFLPWVLNRDFAKPMSRAYSTPAIVNRFLNAHEPHIAFSVLLRIDRAPCDLAREFTEGGGEPVPEVFVFLDLFPDSDPDFWQVSAAMRDALESSDSLRSWIDLAFGVRSDDSGEAIPPARLFSTEHPARTRLPLAPLWQAVSLQQPLVHFTVPPGPFFVGASGTRFELVSPIQRFVELGGTQENFDCCALARDFFFFAGVLGAGTVRLFTRLEKFEPIGTAQVPRAFSDKLQLPFAACAISSHLGLVAASAGVQILTWHIASGRFIREIESRNVVKWLLIADLPPIIVAVGPQHIDVFTVNGRRVATQAGIGPISACCVAIGTDTAVVVGTPAGAVFWKVNFGMGSLQRAKVIDFGMPRILGLGIFDFGSSLLAVDEDGNAKICAVPRARRVVKKKQVGGCATCGKAAKFVFCKKCGMAYCGACIAKQADTLCITCFESNRDRD
jgi:hypothetical protein